MLCAMIVGGCGDEGSTRKASAGATELVGTQWLLDVSALGVSGAGSVSSWIAFERGRVSGNDGCNTFSGSYELDGSKPGSTDDPSPARRRGPSQSRLTAHPRGGPLGSGQSALANGHGGETPRGSVVSGLVGALPLGLGRDHVEAAIEVDVRLAAVGVR